MDLVSGIGTLVWLSWCLDAGWPLIAVLLLALSYIGSIWGKDGRRLGWLFGKRGCCASWTELQFPPTKMYCCPRESLQVQMAFDEVIADSTTHLVIGHVFRSRQTTEPQVRRLVEQWLAMAKRAPKLLVVRRLPRLAAGWAQIDPRSAALSEAEILVRRHEAVCVVGLEPYLVGVPETRPTCVHELVHVAQQLHANLLWREWHGKESIFSSAGLKAEWQALRLAGQIRWGCLGILRVPFFVWLPTYLLLSFST